MGGSALSVPTNPLPLSVYLARLSTLLALFSPYFRISSPRYVASKTVFGDIDLLIQSVEGWKQTVSKLAKEWDTKEILDTGESSMSVEMHGAQVDFVAVPGELFESSLVYYGFGDAGAIVGRVAKKFRMSWGNAGLWADVVDSLGHKIGRVLLSVDPYAVLDFLGFDAGKWKTGFETEEELFTCLAAGRYTDPKLWDPSSFDKRNRRRQKKRPMFARWLAFLSSWHGEPSNVVPPDPFAYFGKTEERDALVASELAKRTPQKKWMSGDDVMRVTGLKAGKQLGAFLKHLRRSLAPPASLDSAKVLAFYSSWLSNSSIA
jgi:hypothetical protein